MEALNQLAVDLDLRDSWRLLHPEDKEYAWSRNQPFTARRLDYMFVSSRLTTNLEQSEILSLPHSDHRAVFTSLTFHKYKRGPSFWKLNNSLLRDAVYINRVHKTMSDFSQEQTDINPHAKWELCKVQIRELSIAYSKHTQRTRRDRMKEYQNKLNNIERECRVHGKGRQDGAVLLKIKK